MVSQEAEDEPPSDDSAFCSSFSFFMFVKMPAKNMKYLVLFVCLFVCNRVDTMHY